MRQVIGMGALLALSIAVAHARTIAVTGRDSASLEAAIAQSEPGDEVRLPPGVFRLTEPLTPRSDTTVRGAGPGQTVLRFAGQKPMPMVQLVNVAYVTIADLTLDAGGDGLVTQGVAGYNSRRLALTRLTIRNLVKGSGFGPHGIHFNGNKARTEGVTDSLIQDCAIENIAPEHPWGAGIRLSWGSSRNRIEGNCVHNTGRGGILADNGSCDLVIRGNTVTGSQGEKLGIEVWGGCDHCVIEDNHIDHWLSIGGSDYCAVRRNLITCHGPDCFGFIGIEAIGTHLVFTDNIVDDGQIIGLSVSGAVRKQYHYYAGNSFRRCTQWAAQLQGEATGASHYYFERCGFSDTTVGRGKVWYPGDEGKGLRFNGNCRNMTFEECAMSGNGRHGIQITTKGGADRLSFVRCRITDNRGAAMIHGGGFTGLEWIDCLVSGNTSNELPTGVTMPDPPTAGFSGPTQARVGQTVQLRSTAQAKAGTIRKVLWDLGDGAPETGTAVRHAFAKTGTYRVTQIVWDTNDRAGRATQDIIVRP